ncbi:energy transducer TonB [Rubrolithibacter danxiaensis]|uniref:energy transducer TonB n=1 Tax=Rubrolithibacter danxiaensis TaxID=3390805 RepID=UPI003BF7884D
MANGSPESENEIKHELLIKKDKSLLYMLIVLLGIIFIMGYLTLFVEDPWKFMHKKEVPVTVTEEPAKSLDESSSMNDEEVRQSLVKFIEAFYYDQKRGYFDPPSYFTPITNTFYNYHNLTYERLKELYWKRMEDMENFKRNWIVSSLEFERRDSKLVATYWAKESFFKPSLNEDHTRHIKYEMIIDESGKISSLKDIEIKNLEIVKHSPDSTAVGEMLNQDVNSAGSSTNQIYDYSVVEVVPEFQGGQKEWQKFISSNLHYPLAAKTKNVQGKVIVSFIVDKDGSIRDVKLRQGIGSGCDEEAIRIVRSSPPWKPGMVKGAPVSTYCVLPITFQLSTQ